MKKRLTLTFWGMLVAFSVMAEAVKVTSPDGEYEFTVSDDGQLSYSLFYQQKEVIEPSRLGIEWNENWYDGIRIVTSRNSRIDKNWKPVYGERAVVKELYNACEIELAKTGSRKRMVLDVRAYNEGVAFRYRFVGGEYLKIENEFTQFTLPKGTLAWHTERAQTPYNLLPLEGWENESDRPLMLQLPEGQYACLAEAQVVDYVRTKFKLSDEKPYTLLTSMYGIVEDIAPYHTPWRIVMCASRPGDILANNDLLLNLNPDCKIADTSWIKPGKVMREVTLTTEGGKALVDFAVKRRLQYIHFDAGWYGFEYDKSSDATTVTLDPRRNEQIDALNLQEVISYAKSKGIGVILYVNQRALQQQLDEILPLYKSWGIAGIKFGFVQVGSQIWTRWMHEAVKKCAQYGLMVDIHDEYRPTGFSRTYPNLMTQEGIRGNEEMPDATHNTILPYTRFLAGAGDYTLCYFNSRVKNTKAHQLAMAAVYYSPLQFMFWYDNPAMYKGEEELEFWKAIPTVWDESRALDGEIGEYIVQARRSGKEWFVGAMTNTEARTITLTTDFLKPGTKYIVNLYEDDDKLNTRTKVRTTHKKIKAGDKLTLKLKSSGGAALHFTLAE